MFLIISYHCQYFGSNQALATHIANSSLNPVSFHKTIYIFASAKFWSNQSFLANLSNLFIKNILLLKWIKEI
jgi:hypothetical protein